VLRTGSLVDDVKLAAETGADALAVMGREISVLGPNRVRQVLDDGGIEVSSVIGLDGWSIDGSPDNLKAIAGALEAAAALGSVGVLVISGPSLGQSPSQAQEALVRRLEAVSPIATSCKVPILLEPMHPILRTLSFVHTFRHAREIVRDIEGTQVVVDTGHLWWDPDLLADFTDNVEVVASVQIADVDRDALAGQSYRRTQLGDGDVDLDRILIGFIAAGFRGYFEYEVLCPMPPEEKEAFFRRGREVFDGFVKNTSSRERAAKNR
jgi:sugar phosphate isomerase/epimerase